MDLLSPLDLPENPPGRDIYTVSRLNSEVRSVLNGSFPLLWVEGEISNLVQPRSGHLYFSLKDANAQVRCAMFRMRRQALRFQPENGDRVLLRGKLNLYEPRGDFQLSVETMEPAGEGDLRRAFEELKNKLAKEGLFDQATKKALPKWPCKVGVITSPSGAAVRDVISVLGRRFSSLEVIIYPTLVQGSLAAQEIASTIRQADARGECDVLIVTRGGGSLEDLAAFNEEEVARAIFAANLPIVSAVGHEIDFTIADFVADFRAATPSVAAEAVSPDGKDLELRMKVLHQRMAKAMVRRIENHQLALSHMSARMAQQHPGQILGVQAQRLDELEQRLEKAQSNRMKTFRQQVLVIGARLEAATPERQLAEVKQRLKEMQARLNRAMTGQLQRRQTGLQAMARELNGVSPLATLGRGYSITFKESDQSLIRNAQELAVGERIITRFRLGEIVSIVE